MRQAVRRPDSLNLRVTDDSKAPRGMKFELRTAIPFDAQGAPWTGAYEKKVLKFRTTDSHGLLSFGEVKGTGVSTLAWRMPIQELN